MSNKNQILEVVKPPFLGNLMVRCENNYSAVNVVMDSRSVNCKSTLLKEKELTILVLCMRLIC